MHSTGVDVSRRPIGPIRMVPVDSFVCELVRRLQFFRSLDPLPADGWLLGRPRTKEALVRQLRDYLHQVCHALGLPLASSRISVGLAMGRKCFVQVLAFPPS
jgi:hypothetical protein